jgi:hypothetical protein
LSILQNVLRKFGLDVVLYREWPVDVGPEDVATLNLAQPFTLTSKERLVSAVHATHHISRHRIPGAVVECGVWRGGSMSAMASTLRKLGDIRDLYLYDTFTGMPEASAKDRAYNGYDGKEELGKCFASLEDVKNTMSLTGYPADHIHYVPGMVEDTIPGVAPSPIALLRLDTDFYESTKHELKHLYPLVSPGGIVIIDDYGFWEGARQAVDEFFADSSVYLHRVDATGRVIVKPEVS